LFPLQNSRGVGYQILFIGFVYAATLTVFEFTKQPLDVTLQKCDPAVEVTSVELVAPEMLEEPRYHWYVYPVPVLALSVTEPPGQNPVGPAGVTTEVGV
jgi:hypothetical protein